MENKENTKPNADQEVSPSRRALIRAGWVAPIILATATSSFAANGQSFSGDGSEDI